jgi:segregation and condensation protein B
MPEIESTSPDSPLPDSAPIESVGLDLEALLRLAEAMVFAATAPVTPRQLGQLLPDGADSDAVLAALQARYAGRGVELVEVGGGWQFRTAPDLAPKLRRVVQVPRRLPRVAMETLAIIAYHQPVTRPEIEELRGAALGQGTLDQLLEAGLVAPRGRKETPGRPTLWGTTPAFLSQFGLQQLRDLPRREDLLVEPATLPIDPPPATPEPDESAPEPPSEPLAGEPAP